MKMLLIFVFPSLNHFRNRFIDANEMKQRMEGKLFLKLSLLRPTMNIAEDRDWTTVAIVSKKMDPQTAKNVRNVVKRNNWELVGKFVTNTQP